MVDAGAVCGWGRDKESGGVTEPPVCACHGKPKVWNERPNRKGSWRCRVLHQEAQRRYNRTGAGAEASRRYRAARKAEGLCTKCGKDVLVTESRCFDCAGKHDEETYAC